MNKKSFKRYMQQGLGRCALLLEGAKDVTKYKDTVLWGCLHSLSYDPQFEGTRAYYVHLLTTYFEDTAYFLRPTVAAFRAVSLRSDRLFDHLCELLRRFAEDGSHEAMEALEEKYALLLSALLQKRGRGGRRDYARDAFERICLTIHAMQNEARILQIAADMGRLFRENPRYTENDFDWFFYAMDGGIGKRRLHALLQCKAKKSRDIALFYERYATFHAVREKTNASAPSMPPRLNDLKTEIIERGALSPSLRVRFASRADEEEKRALAEAVLKEADLNVKAELLSVFAKADEGFPLSHSEIVSCAKSQNEKLRDTAREVLTSCRSEEVRAYALALLTKGEHVTDALQMLICNYKNRDKALLLHALYEIRADYRETADWHGVGSRILGAKALGVRLPHEFFLYVYETTLCSFCRECAVRALAARHALSRELLEECRYDSNADISRYAQRCLSRR